MNYTASICPMTAGRAARTVGGHAVVATRVRAERVGCTDGDYRRLVAGRMNLSVDLSATRILAVVAGSGNYNDSCVSQRACRATDRIILVGTNRWSAQAHVDDP